MTDDNGPPLTSEQKLRLALNNLHDLLEQTDTVDEETMGLLTGLVGDIRTRLDRPEQTEPDAPAVETLDDAIQSFEISHPRIASALEQLIDALAQSGI